MYCFKKLHNFYFIQNYTISLKYILLINLILKRHILTMKLEKNSK